MSRVKYTAANALATELANRVPDLAGKTQAVQEPPHGIADYPALVVLPERFEATWHSSIADLFDGEGEPVTDANASYQQVGYLSGSFQLWLAARYPAAREELEGAILQAFCADNDTPGCIALDIDTGLIESAAPFTQTVTYHLENAEWREEFAFSERRWAILAVEVDLPIRVAQTTAPVVEQYIISLTEDLTDVSDAATPVDALAQLEGVEDHTGP